MPEHEDHEPLLPVDPLDDARRFLELAVISVDLYGTSRELALAKTKIEEAVHWLNAAQEV